MSAEVLAMVGPILRCPTAFSAVIFSVLRRATRSCTPYVQCTEECVHLRYQSLVRLNRSETLRALIF